MMESSRDLKTSIFKKGVEVMKAVRFHDYGDSSVLVYEDAPIPDILPDEVLLKVHSAGVNPIDWKIRRGYRKQQMPFALPLIPGWDVAGTIEQTGALVKTFKIGDAVFARPEPIRNGSYAQYVVVRGFELARAPLNISLQAAAGIPLAAQTAWMAIFERGNLQKGQKILIHGASGGVGNFATQFAKLAGAFVVATTSSKNIELVKSLGADQVIDYQNIDVGKELNDVDLVFDTIGGDTQLKSWPVIRKGGMLVSTVGIDEQNAKQFGIQATSFMLISNGARLQQIGKLVDLGLIRVIIGKEFPLSEARAAQDLSENGHAIGKIILNVQ